MLLCIVGLYMRYQKSMDNKVYIIIFLVTAASAALTITNGPQDTTVCINQVANCTCGFTGADPNFVVPNWRIIKRRDGEVVSDETISGSEIIAYTNDGMEWIPDLLNGNNSVLRVGPVNGTYNQSSYQCSFASLNRIIESSIGTLTVLDPPSLINITVEDTGTTFITISWISTSVGSVNYTISLSSSTGDVIMSHITIGTQYTINGLTSNTSYRISVVPSVGMCQGEGKEVMVDTTGISTNIPRVQPSRSMTTVLQATTSNSIKDDDSESDDDGNTTLIIIFTIIIVLLIILLVIAVVIIIWLCVERYHKLKHRISSEVKTPVNQQQLNTDTIKMQSSPAYVPVGQDIDLTSSIVPQYDTVQVPSDHQDVPMMANPAYLTHKNI
ncbi:uncharacterized protein [Dysidea avara]|uniref:uncharacterized protein isoform X2 n=1 Tax=Dysidea avara TaxID=196820 RepID=UPI00331B590C